MHAQLRGANSLASYRLGFEGIFDTFEDMAGAVIVVLCLIRADTYGAGQLSAHRHVDPEASVEWDDQPTSEVSLSL